MFIYHIVLLIIHLNRKPPWLYVVFKSHRHFGISSFSYSNVFMDWQQTDWLQNILKGCFWQLRFGCGRNRLYGIPAVKMWIKTKHAYTLITTQWKIQDFIVFILNSKLSFQILVLSPFSALRYIGEQLGMPRHWIVLHYLSVYKCYLLDYNCFNLTPLCFVLSISSYELP